MMKNLQNLNQMPEQEDHDEEFKNKDLDIDINEIQPIEVILYHIFNKLFIF